MWGKRRLEILLLFPFILHVHSSRYVSNIWFLVTDIPSDVPQDSHWFLYKLGVQAGTWVGFGCCLIPHTRDIQIWPSWDMMPITSYVSNHYTPKDSIDHSTDQTEENLYELIFNLELNNLLNADGPNSKVKTPSRIHLFDLRTNRLQWHETPSYVSDQPWKSLCDLGDGGK